MKIPVTYASKHPAIVSDRVFFAARPRRRYRARKLFPSELGLPDNFVFFAPDERGEVREVDMVILNRFEGGRFRYHFVKPSGLWLNSDAKIEAFLRSRGIMPVPHNLLWRRA